MAVCDPQIHGDQGALEDLHAAGLDSEALGSVRAPKDQIQDLQVLPVEGNSEGLAPTSEEHCYSKGGQGLAGQTCAGLKIAVHQGRSGLDPDDVVVVVLSMAPGKAEAAEVGQNSPDAAENQEEPRVSVKRC